MLDTGDKCILGSCGGRQRGSLGEVWRTAFNDKAGAGLPPRRARGTGITIPGSPRGQASLGKIETF